MRNLLAIAALLAVASAYGLGVGDKAPPLKVAAFVKGKAVNLKKGVHVVEFWATWCGPCKVSIPHLTQMAKTYRGKVDFTGVSVLENGHNQLGQVRRFVAGMGSKMDYNVAFDGPGKAMELGYLKAAGQEGIPAAFLIKDGTILWIGHPMDSLDKVIDRVLAGSFNVHAAKAEAERHAASDAAETRRQDAEDAAMASAIAAFKRKDTEAGLKELDKIDVSRDMQLAHMVLMKRFYVFAYKGDPRLREVADKLIA
jgi:thiol-disulfide isomerase/thioredoxin